MANKVEDIDYDKATVVSICPFALHEMKPGMFPSFYRIPSARDTGLEILIVNNAFYNQPLPATDQVVRVEISSKDIARSIVNDYIQGVMAYGENCYPGLFWVRGNYDKPTVKTKFATELQTITQYQYNWFLAIVAIADDDWTQFKQHKFITETQRHAARFLGLKREWLIDQNTVTNVVTVNCPACFSMIHPEASICPNCRSVINVDKAAQFLPKAGPVMIPAAATK